MISHDQDELFLAIIEKQDHVGDFNQGLDKPI